MTNMQLLVELAKVGACTAVGGLIDFLMHRSEKARLKDYLETLVLKLDLVKWNTLGQDEAKVAIRCLDSLVGKHLFSMKRAYASSVIALICLGVSGGISDFVGAATYFLDAVTSGQSPKRSEAFLVSGALSSPAVLFIMVAASFSLTRWLSTLATTSRLSGALTYALLLAGSILVFLLWQPLVGLTYGLLGGWYISASLIALVVEGNLDVLSQFFAVTTDRWPVSLFSVESAQEWASTLVNGLRISFALAFAISAWSVLFIRGPILRLGYGIVETKKPFFTLVFTSIGTLIVLTHALMKV